jgi:hypothetical protein
MIFLGGLIFQNEWGEKIAIKSHLNYMIITKKKEEKAVKKIFGF